MIIKMVAKAEKSRESVDIFKKCIEGILTGLVYKRGEVFEL